MIWEKLREARKKRGLTLSALAKLTGLNLNTISRIERGRQPSPTSLKKISEALKLKINTFYK